MNTVQEMLMSLDATPDTTPDATPTARASSRRFSTTDLALIAAFAALISACAYIGAIPVGSAGVPITLQTFAVMLTGCLLGPVRGFAAVALYLTLGAIGLPVFAEHSAGLGAFTSVSAGYLISFPFAAALGGFLVAYVAGPRRKTRAAWVFCCSMAASILVIHPMGIVGMAIHQDVSLWTAATWDAPFWVGDLLKTTLVAIIAAEVHRAFPKLLHP
ncbi:biotin transporter BioY [Mumia sp. zg.B17]|uniref:biotin transporter BioY n=1 Tax=Mumia sp. zg.B17 TaxID=2855446 RepID=UPI0027E25064|nr:biotin transporter BioY [Mumia sp. zg.B17]